MEALGRKKLLWLWLSGQADCWGWPEFYNEGCWSQLGSKWMNSIFPAQVNFAISSRKALLCLNSRVSLAHFRAIERWSHLKANRFSDNLYLSRIGVKTWGFINDWVVLLIIKWRLWVGSNRCHCGFYGEADSRGWPEFYPVDKLGLSGWIPFSQRRSTLQRVFDRASFASTQEFSSIWE